MKAKGSQRFFCKKTPPRRSRVEHLGLSVAYMQSTMLRISSNCSTHLGCMAVRLYIGFFIISMLADGVAIRAAGAV